CGSRASAPGTTSSPTAWSSGPPTEATSSAAPSANPLSPSGAGGPGRVVPERVGQLLLARLRHPGGGHRVKQQPAHLVGAEAESGLQQGELLGQRVAEHLRVVGVDGDEHAGVAKAPDRVLVKRADDPGGDVDRGQASTGRRGGAGGGPDAGGPGGG